MTSSATTTYKYTNLCYCPSAPWSKNDAVVPSTSWTYILSATPKDYPVPSPGSVSCSDGTVNICGAYKFTVSDKPDIAVTALN